MQNTITYKVKEVTNARNEITPLLDELISQLAAEGSQTHCAHFHRIRRRLIHASDAWELTSPIIELSTCTAMGFRFSSTADALVERILEKASELSRELSGVKAEIH
jgi:hypothetical protein